MLIIYTPSFPAVAAAPIPENCLGRVFRGVEVFDTPFAFRDVEFLPRTHRSRRPVITTTVAPDVPPPPVAPEALSS